MKKRQMKLRWQNPANLWDLGHGSSWYSSLPLCRFENLYLKKKNVFRDRNKPHLIIHVFDNQQDRTV